MKAFVACIALALVACASAEPPSGYNYNRPSAGTGGFSGGFSGGISGGLSGGGPIQQVPVGHQTSEGQNVDPQLLEQIRTILLKEESSGSGGNGGGHGGHGGAPSSSYGAPSSSYGPPSTSYGVPSARVVGVVLDGVRQAIQVAQFEQSGGYSGGGGGGYPAAVPSGSYGAPSGSGGY